MVSLPAWLSTRMAAGLGLILLGLLAGIVAARWHYAPRLEAAELRTQALGDLLREQAKGVQALKDESARRVAEAAAALERARGEARQFVGRPRELANRVYANRLGNGDESSGDGWRYRGRGLIQLTGRAHYMAAGRALQRPYKERPELVAEPSDACLTAAWYWHARSLNPLADSWMIGEITRRVNGSKMLGMDDRLRRSEMALEAMHEAVA
jgi:predicted chitinase